MNKEANKEPIPGSVTPSANVEATGIPSIPTVETVETNRETAMVGGVPAVSAPTVPAPVTPPSPTDYKWDAATNTYKEIAKENSPVPTQDTLNTPSVPKTESAVLPGTDKTQAEFDVFKGRENEVLANLNSAYSSGIKDEAGIRKFSSYDTATTEKKAAIDAFISNKKKEEQSANEGSQFGTEEGIFGALNNNVMVPDSVKSSPSYKSAFDRYRKLKFLSGYDANSIAAVLKNGKLVPGSRTYQDLYNTEAGKAKIEKANKILSISGGGVDIGNAGKVLTSEAVKENPSLLTALEDGSLSVDEFKSMTTTPELDAEAKDLAAKQLEIKKLQSARSKIRDDVDKEYGAGLTSSEKAQLVANRTRDINRTLEPLVLEYDSAFGTYSDKKKELVSLFATNFDLYKADKEEKAKQEAIQSQRDYETEKENRKNTYDSVNAQIKFAQENGVDLQRTDANVIIADATKYANENGVSLQEAIKETFTKPLTEKDSYKRALQAIYDKNSGAMNEAQKKQYALELAKFGYEQYSDKAKLAMEERKLSASIAKEGDGWERDVVGYDDYGNPIKGWVRKPGYEDTVPKEDGNIAAEFIRSKEGFREEAYDDATGKPVPVGGTPKGTMTIGYGFTTNPDGSKVKPGDRISKEEADSLFSKKVGEYRNFENLITVPLSESQKAALNSFEYNLGKNIWKGSAKPIIDKINSGDLKGAANEMKKFTFANGVSMKGLVNRRNEEANMLMRAGDKIISPATEGAPHPSAVSKLALYNAGTADYDTISKQIGTSQVGLKIKADLDAMIAAQGGKAVFSVDNPTVKAMDSLANTAKELLDDDEQLENVSGAIQFSPWDSMTKKKQTWLGKASNLLTNETLRRLSSAKDEGATFGALSNQEIKIIGDAATQLGSWAKKDKETNAIIGFDASESAVRAELNKIRNAFEGKADRMTNGEYSRNKNKSNVTDNSEYEKARRILEGLE